MCTVGRGRPEEAGRGPAFANAGVVSADIKTCWRRGAKKSGLTEARPPERKKSSVGSAAQTVSKGTMSSATILMILISGFTAGPAVTL